MENNLVRRAIFYGGPQVSRQNSFPQGKIFSLKAKLSFPRQNFLSQGKTFFPKTKLSFSRQNFLSQDKTSLSRQNFHSQDKTFFLKTKLSFSRQNSVRREQWRRHGGDWGGFVPPNSQSRQKLSMKNGIKLVGYTFRLKNTSKSPPFLSDFSELAPPLGGNQKNQFNVKRAQDTQSYHCSICHTL